MNLQFNAAVIDEDIVYFSAKNFNGLFKWNLKNSKVELIGHFPDEQLWTEHMHQFTIVNAKNIYYLPYMASSITKYDLTSQKLLTVGELGNSVRWGISHVLKYNENYILIPRELTNPISVFYPANEKFEFVDVEITKNAETVYFYSDIFCATIERDTLFVPIYDTNIIIKIDLQSKCKSKVFLDAIKISSIQYYNDQFWIVTSDGNLVNCYNSNFELEKEYRINGNTIRPYESWLQYKGQLYLCGCLDNSLIMYDSNNDVWTEVFCGNNERVNDAWAFICGYQELDGKLYLFPSATKHMHVIENGRIVKYYIEYDNDDLQRKITRKKHNNYFLDCRDQIQYEGEHVGLSNLITYLKNT